MSKNIFAANHPAFIDKVVYQKRLEMVKLIKKKIDFKKISSCLDVGTTKDFDNLSSNIIIKNFNEVKVRKSLSDQKINSSYFHLSSNKSITDDFALDEINKLSSDLVISSATIEHVGRRIDQVKMIENIIKLTKKHFVITTPNRFYPIEFHTKIPFIHWLPKFVHRIILKITGFAFFSHEEQLNLLSRKDLTRMLTDEKFANINYSIESIKLLGLTSNFIIIGTINKL